MTSTTCQAKTKAGKPCKGTPLPNSDFCMAHQPEEPTDELCKHINEHYTKAIMTCDLPAGHEGDHSAEFEATDYRDGQVTFQGTKRTYWGDLAGTPVDQIEPDFEGLKEMQLKRKLAQMAEQGL